MEKKTVPKKRTRTNRRPETETIPKSSNIRIVNIFLYLNNRTGIRTEPKIERIPKYPKKQFSSFWYKVKCHKLHSNRGWTGRVRTLLPSYHIICNLLSYIINMYLISKLKYSKTYKISTVVIRTLVGLMNMQLCNH